MIIEKVVERLRKLDADATDYVLQRYHEGTLNNVEAWYDEDISEIVASLFTWGDTPQGYDYWCRLHLNFKHISNITPLGNQL